MQRDRTKFFLDIEMSLLNYDHDRAVRAYVWKHFRHLMTPLERRVTEYDRPITSVDPRVSRNDVQYKHRRIYEFLENRDGHVDDADVLEQCLKPQAVRKAAAVERVLAECGEKIQIHCCPACSRVLRTPIAQQCLWCGHDWHAAKKA